jgi:hypothetical protein
MEACWEYHACPPACFISKTIGHIPKKFGFEVCASKLWKEFHFCLYQSHLTPALREAEIELNHLKKMAHYAKISVHGKI